MPCIFGIHAVEASLQKADKKAVLWVDSARNDSRIEHCLEKAKKFGLEIRRTDKKQLKKMSKGENHQGIALDVPEKSIPQLTEKDFLSFLEQMETKKDKFFLVLDGVTDPHNLGACLRTANGAGVDAVIVPKDNSASLTPVAIKVASGAVGQTPLFQVTNLARVLRAMADNGVWLIGLDDKSTEMVYNVEFRPSIAVVLGSEGSGVRRLTKEICQQLVTIPMKGEVSSLNVSVAAGVVLYESLRQRNN